MAEQHIEHLKQHFVNVGKPKILAVIDANRDVIDPDKPDNIPDAAVDQAHAELRDAKAAREAGTMTVEEFAAVKKRVADLRQLHRLQENAAARRGLGIIGGDAVITGV